MTNAASGQQVILLIEDDDQVRRMIKSLLCSHGYSVLEARTGTEGLEIAMAKAPEIDLMISDMLLPGLSGYDLVEKLKSRYPAMKVIFITGYVEGEIVQKGIGELGAGFLDKPFQPSVLLKKVRELLANGNSNTSRV